MKVIKTVTAQKITFSIKDFFSKCDQIRSFLENFVFCAVYWIQSSINIFTSMRLVSYYILLDFFFFWNEKY